MKRRMYIVIMLLSMVMLVACKVSTDSTTTDEQNKTDNNEVTEENSEPTDMPPDEKEIDIPDYDELPEDSENVPIRTADNLITCLNNSNIKSVDLVADISAELDNVSLTREFTINIYDHALILSGVIDFDINGFLRVDAGPDGKGTFDISEFSVTINQLDLNAVTKENHDFVMVSMNFKQIIGKPVLTRDVAYNINDSGSQAYIYLNQQTKIPEKKVVEDFTNVLSGTGDKEQLPGEVFLHDTTDGVLIIELDNPYISEEIRLGIEGGATLKLTGSVTFDGGLYRFECLEDSEGRATVDMTELKIYGTEELGSLSTKVCKFFISPCF